jgi:hypothetical protein
MVIHIPADINPLDQLVKTDPIEAYVVQLDI